MIFYGWKSSAGKQTPLPGVSCSSCQQPALHTLTMFRYFHIYWIPFFPFQRKLATNCAHCKAYVEKDEIKDPSVSNALLSVSRARAPIWMFSGLLLIGLLVGAFVADDQRHTAKLTQFRAEPVVGDFYIVKTKEPIIQDKQKFHFRILRLSAVNESKVEFDLSEWVYPTAQSAEKAIREKANAIREFDEESHFAIPREKLKESDSVGGEIKEVIRLDS